MARIRFQFDPRKEFRHTVRGWQKSLGDFMWLWPRATEQIAAVHERLFDTEGGSRPGGSWQPLAEATKHYRESRQMYYGDHYPNAGTGPEGPVLHWTWRLRDSLGDFHEEGTVMSVRRYRRGGMVYGTRHPAGYRNHYGTDVGVRREIIDPEGSRDAVVRLTQKMLPSLMRSHRGAGRFRPR